MKRKNNLFDKIANRENIILADKLARKGKKKQPGIKWFDKHYEKNIDRIVSDLLSGRYKTPKYITFKIYDPKERDISVLPYRDRIIHHGIMIPLEPILTSTYIANSYSCIKLKGVHAALKDIKNSLKDLKRTKYCLKIDIHKFYPSVNHDILKWLLRKKIKDKKLLALLDNIIDSSDGIPIGNLMSQYFGNFYLTYFDHFVKEVLMVKYYFRYADDMVFLAETKQELHFILHAVKDYLKDKLKLKLKKNYQIFPVKSRGIDFLGYVFYHDRIMLRKRIKKKFARKLSKRISKPSLASYLGWAKHCNSKNLIRKFLNNKKWNRHKIKNS